MTSHRDEPSALTTAISLWRAGRAIPLTLYATLREEGFDVPSLERFHRNQKHVPKNMLSHEQDEALSKEL